MNKKAKGIAILAILVLIYTTGIAVATISNYFKLFFKFLHFNNFASNARMQIWIFACGVFYSYLVKITRHLHSDISTLHFSEIRRRRNVGVKVRGWEKESWGNEGRDRDKEIETQEEGLGKNETPERHKKKTDWKAWKRSSINYDFGYLEQLNGFCFLPFYLDNKHSQLLSLLFGMPTM